MTTITEQSPITMPYLFDHSRRLLTIAEVAEVLSISARHVRDLVDEGWLVAADVTDKSAPLHKHLRIHRWSIEALLIERSSSPLPIVETKEIAQWRAEIAKRKKMTFTQTFLSVPLPEGRGQRSEISGQKTEDQK